ncbi:helix-turn-helix transcriptional regulator [Elongatibacter sediminis]|uniref:LuxR C-terminal-related transcriptional regulator n=1 Tax=Elongatibacter sediminis TaxID=3119006 RepID=A0AAW9RFF8_9GAMM
MALLGALILAGAADIFYDYTGGAALPHLVVETIVILASIAMMVALATGIWRQNRSNRQLRHELATLEEQAKAAKRSPVMVEARHGFARLIQQQFEEWGLTQTEKEVAMLLIKGLSFKEIAAVRQTLEKTVRQQASSIYRKAGVNGRHAFSAWFIEDFL